MKERPILFSEPMVRAIQAEPTRKTQTRRVVTQFEIRGPHPPFDSRGGLFDFYRKSGPGKGWCGAIRASDGTGAILDECPYGVPGDRLWVREAHLLDPPIDGTWPSVGDTFDSVDDIPARYRNPEHVIYRATCDWSEEEKDRWRWRPSIFMPRWASRLLLEVEAVRVERLQDISEDDARAEGVAPLDGVGADQAILDTVRGRTHGTHPHVLAYAVGWDTLNDNRAPWASNPWVWVVTFRRVQP